MEEIVKTWISILHSSIKTPIWKSLFTYARRFQFYIVQLRHPVSGLNMSGSAIFQFYIVQLRQRSDEIGRSILIISILHSSIKTVKKKEILL